MDIIYEYKVYGSYKVKAEHLSYFLEGLEKINRKAHSMASPGIRERMKGTIKRAEVGIEPLTAERPFKKLTDKDGNISYEITVIGQPIKVADHEFVATIEHHAASNVIRMVPGADITGVDAYTKAKNTDCDFCQSKRDRLHTYIIRHTDGSLQHVGGQCLKKFFGDEAAKLVRYTFGMPELLATLTEPRDRKPRGLNSFAAYDVMSVLVAAASMVREFGFHKNNSEGSTAAWLRHVMYGWGEPYIDRNKPLSHVQFRDAIMFPKPEDEKLAQEALDWITDELAQQTQLTPLAKSLTTIKSKMKTGSTAVISYSFGLTLDSILNAGIVTAKSVSSVAAIIPMYQRSLSATVGKAPLKPSEFVGVVGDKLPLTEVTVVYTSVVTGQFRDSQLVKMEDADGNSFTWFNSSANELERDAKYAITGKIKKHEEFNGRKTTLLLRVNAEKVNGNP